MLGVVLIWIACCGYAAVVAQNKELNTALWATGGLLFGPIALIAVAGMPDRRLRMFTRHMAEAQGWSDSSNGPTTNTPVSEDEIEAQRRRILGK